MGLICPTVNSEKPAKKDKGALANALIVRLNQIVVDEGGNHRTVAQGLAERLVHTGLFGDDKDSTSAIKVIYERVYGRAPVQKDERKAEIPRLVFDVKEVEAPILADKLGKVNPDSDCDDDEETSIGVKFDDGKEFII